MSERYDVIVVGCGGVGSAVLHTLAGRGLSAVGIDQFEPPHVNGSSHGHTRAIRKAYFEHPDYVPLLDASFALWRQLEHDSGQSLFHQVGILEVGPADGLVLNGIRKSVSEHDLDVEFLGTDEARARYPGFTVPDGFDAAFEHEAGYLLVEDCIEANLSLAVNKGAVLQTKTTMLDWTATASGVRVNTSAGVIEGGSLVLAGGPWAPALLGELGNVRISILQKHMYWYENEDPRYRSINGFPVFAVEVPSEVEPRIYYGFPQIDEQGVKVAEHTGGEVVSTPELVPARFDRDQARTRAFLSDYLPGVSRKMTRHEPCFYSMSHDENFYVDVHPNHDNVAYVAGLSGHGFKFAPVLGEILADLATGESPAHRINFLRARR